MRALNQPTSWWGWHWHPPTPMSITEILLAGNMSPRMAALLWTGFERGASIIIAAEPPNSGKTTTLSALLSFTPPDTLVYFTRGQGETFALPRPDDSYPTYLLINEMSDHIPVYTWDDNARRAFELLADGYSLATTMHDETVEGVIGQLERDLSIPKSQIANLTFVTPMYISPLHNGIRRLTEIAFLRPDGEGMRIGKLAAWDHERDEFSVLPVAEDAVAYAEWAGMLASELSSELDRREHFLTKLIEQDVLEIPLVNQAVESYYEEVLRPARGV